MNHFKDDIFGKAPARFNESFDRALQGALEAPKKNLPSGRLRLRSVILVVLLVLTLAATAFAVYYKVIGDRGAYTVGSEIEPGFYVYTVAEGNGLFALDIKNKTGPNWGRYHKPYGPAEYWMYMTENTYISIKPEVGVLSFVNDADIPKVDLETVRNGRFFVGLQVEPGTYTVEPAPDTDRNFYRITLFENEIIEPDAKATYFEMNGAEKTEISLKDGEVIEVVNCILKRKP